jgi:hypothetical protein
VHQGRILFEKGVANQQDEEGLFFVVAFIPVLYFGLAFSFFSNQIKF